MKPPPPEGSMRAGLARDQFSLAHEAALRHLADPSEEHHVAEMIFRERALLLLTEPGA